MATSKLERARNALKNARERSEEAVANGVTSLVTVGSAGAMAYANVRFGDDTGRLKVAGIDADLAGGLLFHALGFAGLGAARSGRAQMATMVMHGLGNGLLSSYAVFKAAEIAGAVDASPQRAAGRLPSPARNAPPMNAYSRAVAEGRV